MEERLNNYEKATIEYRKLCERLRNENQRLWFLAEQIATMRLSEN